VNADVLRDLDEVVAETGIVDILPLLGEYIAAQRWSAGGRADIIAMRFVDVVTISEADPLLMFTIVEVHYAGNRKVRYALPIGIRQAGDPLAERAPTFVIGEAAHQGRPAFFYDATGDPEYVHWIWNSVRRGSSMRTAAGADLSFHSTGYGTLEADDDPDIHWLHAEQSNTSMIVGEATFLKHLRRVEPGPAHELEMAEALHNAGFTSLAPTLGVGLYSPPGEDPGLLTIVQEYLHNGTEGWALALTSLRDLYANAEEDQLRGALDRQLAVDEQGANFAAESARLGAVTARMHMALTSRTSGAAMEPVPLTRVELNRWADEMTAELDRLLAIGHKLLAPLRDVRSSVLRRIDWIRRIEPGGLCTRVHGDLHLGQVLRTDSGWVVLDFEGEPDRTTAERRVRTSPLRDVAGMLRSFDYAAAAALAERAAPGSPDWTRLVAQGDAWAAANREAFWAAYFREVGDAELLPAPGASLVLRRAFEVQKAIYEVTYELGHRPSWVQIPMRFLLLGAS